MGICLLQASEYLNKLPARFAPDDKILVADTMVATGEAAHLQHCHNTHTQDTLIPWSQVI